MATYNILMMGASYGSLLASKMLFGGHKIHHVCLPAEADLINAEGFRVRLPVKGRKDPVILDSRKLPGKVTAGGAAGIDPKNYDLIGLAMQEPQYRSPGVRELLDAVAKSRVPCMSIMNMPPLPYVKRIPGLDYEALKPAYTDAERLGQLRSGLAHAVQPRPAGDPPARGEGQRADGHAADQLQGGEVRQTTSRPASCASSRRTIDAVRFDHADDRQDRAAGEAARVRLALRAARQVVDAAGRQLPLRHQGRHAHRAGGRAQRHRDLALGLQLRHSTCASSSAPAPGDLVPFEKYAAAAQSLVRPASAARALQNGAPNIERADKLVQLIAKQKGLSHPAIDAQVALVDERIAANRKKAAA